MNAEQSVRDIKLSTVVPASITGEDRKNHELGGVDLAMKLHYVTTVHFFGGEAAEGMGIHDYKRPMFEWLQLYYPICGRLRRHQGRPYVKCNDSGVRIVEATCDATLRDWLAAVGAADHHRLLVYHQPVLAPDFGFTPLVFLQITKFKCGGVSLGLRWAHVLGDAFSAVECLNAWGKIMANQAPPPQSLTPPSSAAPVPQNHHPCRSVKVLEALGDNWIAPNNSKMQMHTFHFRPDQLSSSGQAVDPFDVVCAVVWKSVAKVTGTDIVTVCRRREFRHGSEMPAAVANIGNGHQVIIGTVEAPTPVADADRLEVARLIAQRLVDETSAIEEEMERGKGNVDLMVYGANLTFVDLGHVDLYGLQLGGRGPVSANLSIGGVGEAGAVVVLPDSSGGGRVVNVLLPLDQLRHVIDDLALEFTSF